VPGTKSSNPPEQGFGTQPIQELNADGTSSSNPLSSSGESANPRSQHVAEGTVR
jgi:hypothetical protein